MRAYSRFMPAVAQPLAPYVTSLTVYDSDRGEAGVHLGLPSTSLTLVIAQGEALDVGWGGRPDTRRRFWAHLSGLYPGPAEIHHGGRMSGVQLGLTIAGARALFGVPASQLAGHLLEVGDVDAGLRDLPERLAEAPVGGWARLVEASLIAALARHEAAGPRAEVGRSLSLLTRGVSVQGVADDVGYSRRHVRDLVRAECGLAPKELSRVARFQRAHALVRAGRPLARAASEAGYADQSHLTREWTALAGCSPAAWIRRELPFVQDL